MSGPQNVHVLPTPGLQANEHTIELLEDLLAKAKRGEIQQIVSVSFSPSGDSLTAVSPTLGTLKIIGALERLKFDMLCAQPMEPVVDETHQD